MEQDYIWEEFFDGEISPQDEEKMFYDLLVDKDFRANFKRRVALETAVKSSSEFFTPPSTAVIGLFSRLGIDPAPKSTWGLAGAKRFIKNNGSKILFGAATFAAGVVTVLLLGKIGFPDIFAGKASSSGGTASVRNYQNLGIPYYLDYRYAFVASGLGKIDSEEASGGIFTALPDNKSKTAFPDTKNSPNEITETKSPDKDSRRIGYLNILPNSDPVSPTIEPLFLTYEPTPPAEFKKAFSGNFAVRFMNTNYWSLPEPTISPEKYADFNNISIAGIWKPSERFALGVEYRRENFFLRFESVEELGETFVYETQPNFETFSALFEYKVLDFYSPILGEGGLYGLATAGGNRVGRVFRIGTRAEIYPFDVFGFSLGFDYGYMGFDRQGKSYGSEKIGVNYGVSYRF